MESQKSSFAAASFGVRWLIIATWLARASKEARPPSPIRVALLRNVRLFIPCPLGDCGISYDFNRVSHGLTQIECTRIYIDFFSPADFADRADHLPAAGADFFLYEK